MHNYTRIRVREQMMLTPPERGLRSNVEGKLLCYRKDNRGLDIEALAGHTIIIKPFGYVRMERLFKVIEVKAVEEHYSYDLIGEYQ